MVRVRNAPFGFDGNMTLCDEQAYLSSELHNYTISGSNVLL